LPIIERISAENCRNLPEIAEFCLKLPNFAIISQKSVLDENFSQFLGEIRAGFGQNWQSRKYSTVLKSGCFKSSK
jgi:hypothetical protein